jgi:hypothetical protein
MARTLQQLKESVEKLISEQGPDAPVAAFIFTNEDVFEMDEEGEPQYLPIDFCHKVLDAVESDYDYLYTEIFNCIENELKDYNLITND